MINQALKDYVTAKGYLFTRMRNLISTSSSQAWAKDQGGGDCTHKLSTSREPGVAREWQERALRRQLRGLGVKDFVRPTAATANVTMDGLPFHDAVARGYEEVIKLLLNRDAEAVGERYR